METILEGEVLSNRDQQMAVMVAGHEIYTVGDEKPGDHVYCCIRPENVTVSVSQLIGKSSARNMFPGRIVEIASM